MPKEGTLWDFSTSIQSPNIKKFEGPFEEKSLTMPKKLKGGPFSLARFSVTRKRKQEKPSLVQFAWRNGSIRHH